MTEPDVFDNVDPATKSARTTDLEESGEKSSEVEIVIEDYSQTDERPPQLVSARDYPVFWRFFRIQKNLLLTLFWSVLRNEFATSLSDQNK